MQPQPTEISTHIPYLPNPDTSTTSQYGFRPRDLLPAELLTEQQGDYATSAASTDTSSSSVGEDSSDDYGARLNSFRTKLTTPPVQRITEYEKAASPSSPRRYGGGPEFKIIKNKGSRLEGPQLVTFPNEVLTHILSHLPASSLSSVSLVSRRFYNLVTTPHAWRIAFSRFFAAQDVIEHDYEFRGNRRGSDNELREQLRSEQRFFTRLTALASWRSEYVLRTRLLRSLGRGKPAQIAPGHGASSRPNSAVNNTNAVVTYTSQLFATINHIHATFSNGKKSPRFIHGTDETGSACTSDPNVGKVDNWGLSDPQSLPQFADLFPGDQPYGLGEGLVVGVPNVMDVSQPFGLVYGEGFPGGQIYYRSSGEMRGRFLANTAGQSIPQSGIPQIPSTSESVCAVWLAKSSTVPNMTNGLIGIMSGSSCGVITTYSLGVDNLRDSRLKKGEITCRWMISPGVPIIAISVDESYSVKRKAAGRIWAVALNALGEVYYLSEVPQRSVEWGARLEDRGDTTTAWETGRNAYWHLAEPTRRRAREDFYEEAEVDGSYTPRSSSKAMKLSKEQLVAETNEIQKFLCFSPAHFRKLCYGWDMQRKMEVDFAGDDGKGAGENIIIIDCGAVENSPAQITRFTRLYSEQASLDDYPLPRTPLTPSVAPSMASLFGGGHVGTVTAAFERSPIASSTLNKCGVSPPLVEEWRASVLLLNDFENIEISASAIDTSTFALMTAFEDPILSGNGASSVFPPFAAPTQHVEPTLSDVPGHRARFIAVGNNAGTVMLWNMRGPYSSNPALTNELKPLRTIYTDSPQISCLALSALYIIHGGNDGLVQAWDPLASTLQPIRTLNSRFSSRARRRLVQAEASIQGVGINLYAAGAIAIDPDPTVLRGMVSLGTHLRYWSYSSTAADRYSSKKRKIRRSSERGNNGGPDRFTSTGRGALMDYIATEQDELKKEKERRAREEARLRGRFGVGMGGLSEEEALRYAEMISQETFQKDQARRLSDTDATTTASSSGQGQSVFSCDTITPDGSITIPSPSPKYKTEDDFDHDIEEAIRLSLIDGVDDVGRSPRASGSGNYSIPITYKQRKSRRSASSSPSTSQAPKSRVMITQKGHMAVDDLDFALQLSLAEERSRLESSADDFPELDDVGGRKGKGRAGDV